MSSSIRHKTALPILSCLASSHIPSLSHSSPSSPRGAYWTDFPLILYYCQNRQGTLPFATFWVSTRPFGTPLGPYTLKWALTIIMILAPPAGDAFNFVVDLNNYPSSFFSFLMALGIYFVRYQRKKLNLARLTSREGGFRAWEIAVLFTIAVNLYLLVMPWYPPPGGATGGDVSFWYATYVVTGIGM